MNLPGTDLDANDLEKLARCAIPAELARQAKLRRVNSTEGGQIIGRNGAGDYGGLIYPYIWPGQAGPREFRLRLDSPEMEYKDGRLKEKSKYLSPPGRGNLLYAVPGTTAEWLADPSIPIVLLEGEKKTLAVWTLAWRGVSDASDRPRFLPIGMPGVWSWRGTIAKAPGPDGSPRPVKGAIADLSKIAWQNRKVTIAFDINVTTNESVQHAHSALTAEMKRRGSQVHHFVWPVDTPLSVNGLDDLVAAVGPDPVLELIENAPPADRKGRTDAGAERPRICSNGRQLRDISADALTSLQAANDPAELYARGGVMVAVTVNEKGRRVISPVGEWALRGRLARCADYFKVGEKGDKHDCAPPIEVVRDILALSPGEWQFPLLEGLTEIPVIRPDGTILDIPGYDPATGFYYAPDPGLCIPEIEMFPTTAHIDEARTRIEEVFWDFPFVDQASKANGIGGMFNTIVKTAIKAPVPLQVNDAPQAGTGKSLLADIISITATGWAAEMFSAPKDDDEWRKQITTALVSGTSIVVFDNVTRPLDSGELCKVLTATQYADRAFRTHDKILLPVNTIFIATGNNVRLRGDMPRRCYHVRLDAEESRPFLRTQFKHPDLKKWVSEHRGELLAALLTLARAWWSAGCPKPKVKPFGSYEAWATTVGGILEHAGVIGFLDNANQMYDEADTESAEWQGFLEVLHTAFHGDAFTVAEIAEVIGEKTWNEQKHISEPTGRAATLREAMPEWLAEVMDKELFRRRAGKCFGEIADRRFGERQAHIKRSTKSHGIQQWQVAFKAETKPKETAGKS